MCIWKDEHSDDDFSKEVVATSGKEAAEVFAKCFLSHVVRDRDVKTVRVREKGKEDVKQFAVKYSVQIAYEATEEKE